MQQIKQRSIALGTAGAMLLTTFSGLSTVPAHASSKLWKDLAIGAGVVTGYGLLKHKRSTAVIGGIATGLSYYKYRQEKKKEARRTASTYYSYPTYSSSSSYYSTPTRNYDVSPYRYTRPSYHRSYYHSTRSYHHYRRSYPYHPALHRASYPYHPALHRAVYPYHAELHDSAVKPVSYTHAATAAVVPAAAALAATHRAQTTQATTTAPANTVAPATTAPVAAAPVTSPVAATGANNGLNPLSMGLGFLLALLGVGVGLAASNARHRPVQPVDATYPRFDRTQGRTI